MHQRPVWGNMVHMLAKDLEIIDRLRAGSRKFLNDALRIAIVKLNSFAFVEFGNRNEVLAISEPEGGASS